MSKSHINGLFYSQRITKLIEENLQLIQGVLHSIKICNSTNINGINIVNTDDSISVTDNVHNINFKKLQKMTSPYLCIGYHSEPYGEFDMLCIPLLNFNENIKECKKCGRLSIFTDMVDKEYYCPPCIKSSKIDKHHARIDFDEDYMHHRNRYWNFGKYKECETENCDSCHKRHQCYLDD